MTNGAVRAYSFRMNTDQRTARYAGAPQKYHATVGRARVSRRRCLRAGPGRRG